MAIHPGMAAPRITRHGRVFRGMAALGRVRIKEIE